MNVAIPDNRRGVGSVGTLPVNVLLVLFILGMSFLVFGPLVRKAVYNYYLDEEAKPVLTALVAAERRYFKEHGQYYASPKNLEKDLEDNLGVKLSEAGNFCFMVRTTADFITDSSSGPFVFEVWAVLRDKHYSAENSGSDRVFVQGLDLSCTTAPGKQEANGVFTYRNGRIFALREPTPPDICILPTTNAGPPRTGRTVARIEWRDGFTYSDIYK
ncbi:MAG: hypothetical protein HQL87_05550 [Magnetococcales bacterium]|nr:hypothetical protein [Magnetococcales bacterium]